jgi:hypothetical protein
MKKKASSNMHQKVTMTIAGIVFIALASWLYSNQQQINKHSSIATALSFAQVNATSMQRDADRLLEIVQSKDNAALENYITKNSTTHKEWLASLLTGADGSEPLATFTKRYLSLLIKLKVSTLSEIPSNHHKLLRLIEDISLPQENIIYLSQQRMLTNLSKLNTSTTISSIILLCLVATFIATLIINYLIFAYQEFKTTKYRRLSLYFTDHPNILLRISSDGKIRYLNNRAQNLIRRHHLAKYKLLPSEIGDYVKRAIKEPERSICYQHQIAQCALDCEIRFCKSSQQIFVSMTELANLAMKNKPAQQQSLKNN